MTAANRCTSDCEVRADAGASAGLLFPPKTNDAGGSRNSHISLVSFNFFSFSPTKQTISRISAALLSFGPCVFFFRLADFNITHTEFTTRTLRFMASSDFPELDEVLAHQKLFEAPTALPVHALPDRQYLEQAILPLLIHGLEATARQRPNDPLEFLAAYLCSNNPQRADPLPEMPHPMLYGAGFSTITALEVLKANQNAAAGQRTEISGGEATLGSPPASPSAPASKK